MALSAARKTDKLGAGEVILSTIDVPQAVGTVYNGGIVVVSAGYGQAAAAGLGLICAGRAHNGTDSQVNAGSAGDKTLRVDQGVFRFDNSASTDLIAQADVGKVCYLVDDQKVALTSSSGARSIAGVIMAVDSSGVYVSMGLQLNALIAATGAAGANTGPVQALAPGNGAAGVINVTSRVTTYAGNGTNALSLADGLFNGQRKTVTTILGSNTPAGTITPAHPSGFAAVAALNVIGDIAEFIWENGFWYLVSASGTLTIT